MEKHITATQAVREFSDILNTIRFKGDHFIIIRNGKPIAQMKPYTEADKGNTLRELKAMIKRIPGLDEERASYEKDVEQGITNHPCLPEKAPWE
ncbi:MAG: type II toxin-antitoxin system Phd/YefM family antitoxin [Desulfobacterium sp.]|nr:type II toxin-antitoxin system Phd/YefM family antitoxin [Desulfobacterium sp.]